MDSIKAGVKLYKTGDIVSTLGESPAARWGGTWERITDKFLLGAGGEYELEEQKDSKTIKLGLNQLPPRAAMSVLNTLGWTKAVSGTEWKGVNVPDGDFVLSCGDDLVANKINNNLTSTGDAIDIMPPYLAVNLWQCIDDSTVKRVMIA